MFLCASLISELSLKLRRSVTAILAFKDGATLLADSEASVEFPLAAARVVCIAFNDG